VNALVGHTGAELRLYVRDKTVVLFSLFFPVITVVFFGYLNRGGQVGTVSYASFLIAGGIGMVVTSAAFQNLSAALARQRDAGILKRVGGTPLRVRTLVGAKLLVAAAVILAQTAVLITVNVVLFQAQLGGNLFWMLVVLTLGIVTFSTMGIALAGFCRNAEVAAAAGVAVALPMQFLCGTLFPLQDMPPVLRHLAHVLPLTYFVDALRVTMLGGGSAADVAKNGLVLVACLAVAFPVAVKTFRWE
jgi:ABC-2 type transport system permease protein